MPTSRTALLLALCVSGALGAQEKKSSDRQPVPDAARQKEAEKAVRDLFKAEYAQKTAPERKAFAQTLLHHARESKDDPAAQWILFREAQDIAIQAGDFDLAIEAVDAAASTFDIPGPATKLALLNTAAKAAKTPDELARIVDQLLKLLDPALAADDYDAADKELAAAGQTAKRANIPALLARVAARGKELSEIKARFEKVKKSLDTLIKDPENPAANLEVGLFLVFTKKNWEEGLPLLAKGSDLGLKAAANKDLAHPSEPGALVEAGDAWWELSEKEKNDAAKKRLALRAVSWYEQALPAVAGLTKTKVDQRLDIQKRRELALGLETLLGEKSANPFVVVCDADDGHFEETLIGGKPCVRLTNATIANSDGTRYLYVHIVPKWQDRWKPVEIEMEYYDEGNGSVDIQYDAVAGIYKPGLKSFTLSGSKTWKSFTFSLPEPLFAGRLKSGSDFRLHIFPGSPMPVHRIVLRVPQK